jgi:hypothetical protein
MEVAENKKYMIVAVRDDDGFMMSQNARAINTLKEAEEALKMWNRMYQHFPGYTHKIFVEL